MKKRPLSDQECQAIIDMHKRGLKASDIARLCNRDPGTVNNVLRRAGLGTGSPMIASLPVEIGTGVLRELSAAAARRRLRPAQLAAGILTGVIRKGSIDRALAGEYSAEGTLLRRSLIGYGR